MMSLEFFIDIILLAALWPWGRLSLWQKWVPAGAYGWQPYHLHVPIVLKSGNLNLLEPSGPVQACNGIALPFFLITSQANMQSTCSQFFFIFLFSVHTLFAYVRCVPSSVRTVPRRKIMLSAVSGCLSVIEFNPLNTKRRLLYLKT